MLSRCARPTPHRRESGVSRLKYHDMKELEKKLKDLQKSGYETITIQQVLQWMSDIKREARVKAWERKHGVTL